MSTTDPNAPVPVPATPAPPSPPAPAPTSNYPFPPGSITLFASDIEMNFSGVSQINWSAYPQCPNLVTFTANGVNYYSTLPFVYSVTAPPTK